MQVAACDELTGNISDCQIAVSAFIQLFALIPFPMDIRNSYRFCC